MTIDEPMFVSIVRRRPEGEVRFIPGGPRGMTGTSSKGFLREIDRWLAQVKREAAAQALDEAAAALVVDRVEGSTYSAGLPLVTAEWASAHTERWLRARAASIRSGATS